jgi:hypothetical protein
MQKIKNEGKIEGKIEDAKRMMEKGLDMDLIADGSSDSIMPIGSIMISIGLKYFFSYRKPSAGI